MNRFSIALSLLLLLPACAPDAAEEIPAEEAVEEAAPPPDRTALLDPNIADPDELAGAGLSPEAIAALIQGRPYDDMLQVDAALGELMDAEAREDLYSLMFLRLDLNAASAEEIMLIPGVGSRMAHEFDEYRPYAEIIEFRREIGKYVDDEEVTRLERYVRIP